MQKRLKLGQLQAKPMTRKMPITLTGLNLERLNVCPPETLQLHFITAAVVALGSNHQAEKHLLQVREWLAALGQVQLSKAFKNPDFIATADLPKPDYTNQCVHIELTSPMTLEQLQQTFKAIEGKCNRQRLTKLTTSITTVTMDIDILLIQTVFDKNSLSKDIETNRKRSDWIIMANRYPFKAHDQAGIEELISYG